MLISLQNVQRAVVYDILVYSYQVFNTEIIFYNFKILNRWN